MKQKTNFKSLFTMRPNPVLSIEILEQREDYISTILELQVLWKNYNKY